MPCGIRTNEKPTINRPPPSSLLASVKSFLLQTTTTNPPPIPNSIDIIEVHDDQESTETDDSDSNEEEEEGEGQYIQMNIGVGVFDMKPDEKANACNEIKFQHACGGDSESEDEIIIPNVNMERKDSIGNDGYDSEEGKKKKILIQEL